MNVSDIYKRMEADGLGTDVLPIKAHANGKATVTARLKNV